MQGDICIFVTLHVSVWVEMKTLLIWASRFWSHAPRERVSWNCLSRQYIFYYIVTLHVSVWVEIHVYVTILWYFRSRSTWACELKFPVWPLLSEYSSHAPRERVSWNVFMSFNSPLLNVTLHVSVWVEMLHFRYHNTDKSHAPRERVSWNFQFDPCCLSIPKVTLHVSVWVEIWQIW